MEEVRNIAVTYYNKLTVEQKVDVRKYFQSIDGNGDGKIVIREFLDSLGIKESSRSWYYRLFQDLDRNGNGSLDFNEFITFYYLKIFSDTIRCAGCGVILNGNLYFTCVHCFDRSAPSFDLCRSCYSSNNFTHYHLNGVAPVFRDTSSLLLHLRNQIRAGVNNASTIARSRVNPARAAVAVVNNVGNIVNLIGLFVNSGCTIM